MNASINALTQDPTTAYHDIRFAYDPRRAAPWRAIGRYVQPWVNANEGVLELGAGYGEFIQSVQAKQKFALDLNPALAQHWGAGVTPLIQSALLPLPLPDASVGTVLASNFFEHFTHDEGAVILKEALRVLRPQGRIIAVQPNFRLSPHRYFDDYTHKTIFTDQGFQDFLRSLGYKIAHAEGRFMPFSMKSHLPTAEWLVRLYLSLPIRPLAGQFLVIAEKTP